MKEVTIAMQRWLAHKDSSCSSTTAAIFAAANLMCRCVCWRNFLSAVFASSSGDGFSEVAVVSVSMDPAWRLASSKWSIIVNFT